MFRIPYFIAKVEPWDTIKEQIISAINSASDYYVDPQGFESDYYHNNYTAQVYGILNHLWQKLLRGTYETSSRRTTTHVVSKIQQEV